MPAGGEAAGAADADADAAAGVAAGVAAVQLLQLQLSESEWCLEIACVGHLGEAAQLLLLPQQHGSLVRS